MSAADKAVRKRAAEWLALREARGFTALEHARFAEWCAADPRHAAIFAEVEGAWRTFDRLAEFPHSADVGADPDLLARPKRRWSALGPPVLAAAAALVVAVFWWQGRRAHVDSAAVPMALVDDTRSRVLHLSDGSEVELNAHSEVTEHFTAGERRVRLVRGEAHFTVTKNAQRPFVVDAGGVAVRAVGTAFNVRRDAGAVEVLVTEGRVAVRPLAVEAATLPAAAPPTDAILGAGQRIVVATAPASVASAPQVETLTAPAIDQALAWQSRRLILDATPLAEIVARINREAPEQRANHRLTVADATLGALRISGRIRTDNVENFIEVLEANFGVVAERRADGEIVLRRR